MLLTLLQILLAAWDLMTRKRQFNDGKVTVLKDYVNATGLSMMVNDFPAAFNSAIPPNGIVILLF
ncbi:MAG: hypothetical protein ACKO2H_05645, partial [Bacteroidota bacterium]